MNRPYRDETVTSTAGPVGASFAVAEINWTCTQCKAENFAKRPKCIRCQAKKPFEGGGVQWHAGMSAVASEQDHNWREALDPNTNQIYYYNQVTKATQWHRPEEMGAIPLATGWYGRGKAGAQTMYDENNERYLQRPAPLQQKELASNGKVAYHEGAHEYNIWYGRYLGDNYKEAKDLDPAESRVNVELHSGYTLGDKQASDNAYFCIWYARGLCNKGRKCKYFHRIPTVKDCGRLEKDMMHDCFGRERHAAHRDDMSGVGCFNDGSRTLYICGIKRAPYDKNPKELNKVLEKHFGEFGEVEHVNVIWRKSIAFVRYRLRSNAEFGKIAMACQALDHNEVLQVNWAREDPNPVAKQAIIRANADAVVAAVKAAGHSLSNSTFQHPSNYALPDDEKLIEDKGAEYYPTTDGQYAQPETQPVAKRQKIDIS